MSDPTSTHRLFVALYPRLALRDTLAALATPLRGFRWTPPEQLHLTLRFIGEVESETAGRATAALERVKVAAFPLRPAGVETLPPRGQPRVVCVGFGSAHPHLFQLRQQIDDTLLSAGLRLELPPFHPHITVARCGEAGRGTVAEYVKRHRDFTTDSWMTEGFRLMESHLGPAGSLHTLRREYPLEPA